MGQLLGLILLCPIKIDFGLEFSLNGMERCFFRLFFFKTTFILNTIVTNDEYNEQIFNSFCINLNFIFLQLNQWNLNSIQVACNVIQYSHLNGTFLKIKISISLSIVIICNSEEPKYNNYLYVIMHVF
jgi:hypothetical protein